MWKWLRGILEHGTHFGFEKRFYWTGYEKMPGKWKYFKDDEVKGLSPALVEKLDLAREKLGAPIVITSGYRSPSANRKAGGVKDSAHEMGLAVDIRARDAESRATLIKALRSVGFVRIGVYDKHVHADIDTSKPQVAWAGGISHA